MIKFETIIHTVYHFTSNHYILDLHLKLFGSQAPHNSRFHCRVTTALNINLKLHQHHLFLLSTKQQLPYPLHHCQHSPQETQDHGTLQGHWSIHVNVSERLFWHFSCIDLTLWQTKLSMNQNCKWRKWSDECIINSIKYATLPKWVNV